MPRCELEEREVTFKVLEVDCDYAGSSSNAIGLEKVIHSREGDLLFLNVSTESRTIAVKDETPLS